jgi:hypothetical protein
MEATRASSNRQLKFIVSLLMLTGARPGELMRAAWSEIDLDRGIWHVPKAGGTKARQIPLCLAALKVLRELPRWDACKFVIANPATRKPYRSISQGWEAARAKAGLPYLELEDLRHCYLAGKADPSEVGDVVIEASRVGGVITPPSVANGGDRMANCREGPSEPIRAEEATGASAEAYSCQIEWPLEPRAARPQEP